MLTVVEPPKRTEIELPPSRDFDEMRRLFPERPSSHYMLEFLLVWWPFRKKRYCPLGMLWMHLDGIRNPNKVPYRKRFPSDGTPVLLRANPYLGKELSRTFAESIIKRNDRRHDPEGALTILRDALQYRPS